MLRQQKFLRPPARGAYDYLLDGMMDLPPKPPERGGGDPRRVVINIDLVPVSRPAPLPPTPFWRPVRGFVLFVVFTGLLLAVCHSQPVYEHWQGPGPWHGQVRQEGRTTDWDTYGPQGEQRHCHRYFVGDQAYTTCR